jgi:hypothetical protein
MRWYLHGPVEALAALAVLMVLVAHRQVKEMMMRMMSTAVNARNCAGDTLIVRTREIPVPQLLKSSKSLQLDIYTHTQQSKTFVFCTSMACPPPRRRKVLSTLRIISCSTALSTWARAGDRVEKVIVLARHARWLRMTGLVVSTVSSAWRPASRSSCANSSATSFPCVSRKSSPDQEKSVKRARVIGSTTRTTDLQMGRERDLAALVVALVALVAVLVAEIRPAGCEL